VPSALRGPQLLQHARAKLKLKRDPHGSVGYPTVRSASIAALGELCEGHARKREPLLIP
jgi:hypothetical protein